jgi:[methyl-Co(III) methanol-specific corrinoid protein]:coenzyme M methyltransferase
MNKEKTRKDLLTLFEGKNSSFPLIFSGLISLTVPGLEREGLLFHEAHHDAAKMARAAASTYRVSGFGSAVVPLDLCVEAEALGATVDFREGSEAAEFPRVAGFLYDSVEKFATETQSHRETKESLGLRPPRPSQEPLCLHPWVGRGDSVAEKGRIPLVIEAIKLLKEDLGNEIVIGGYLPGPFTLLSLLVETGALYISMRRSPQALYSALEFLSQVLAGVGNAYQAAGADFLTIHEMGGSPGALGPKLFETIVLPHLQALISALPRPVVLSACGRTNGTMKLLAASGADALSVDQTNDLARSREETPNTLLFGNLDPLGLISQGTPAQITEAVAGAVRSGADAIWPGCDLYPQTPLENLRALVAASKAMDGYTDQL